MNQGSVLKRLFGRVVAEYAEFLFYAWDDEREEVIGVGHAIPAAWDGDRASLPDGGFDAVIEARFAPEPRQHCAMVPEVTTGEPPLNATSPIFAHWRALRIQPAANKGLPALSVR
jgi:hypothetical protein